MPRLSQDLSLEQRTAKRFALTQKHLGLTLHESECIENTLKKMLSCKKRELAEYKTFYSKQKHSSGFDVHHHLEHLKQLRKNVFYFCAEVIGLVNKKLLPQARSPEERVLFFKVKGDFLRYSAECFKKGDPYYNRLLQDGFNAYRLGYEIARNELSCENSSYLNLCLNFSVFYFTIAGDVGKACELISTTLEELERKKELICPEIWKSIQPSVCLLRNNLVLWLSEYEEEEFKKT